MSQQPLGFGYLKMGAAILKVSQAERLPKLIRK